MSEEIAARLGVDIGRVIIDGSSHPDGDDTAFLHGGPEQVLRTPAVAGAFEVLPRLVAGPEKAIHCAELGITHFVDDRPDVHEHLNGVVAHRYLFGPQSGPPPEGVLATPSWVDVERAITSALIEAEVGPPPAEEPPTRLVQSGPR